jgi:hypothetical protein
MPPSFPPDQRDRRCPPSRVPVTSAQATHDKPHRPSGRRTKPLFPAGPPHHDRENASTRSSRNAAISGYGRAGGTTAGRSDRDHRDPRPRDRDRDREGSPGPGRPQARRPRQRDRDIQGRRLAITAPIAPAMPAVMISTVDHVAFWLADANHPSHTSAPVRTKRKPAATGARWASPRTSGASGQYRHDHPEIQRVASSS